MLITTSYKYESSICSPCFLLWGSDHDSLYHMLALFWNLALPRKGDYNKVVQIKAEASDLIKCSILVWWEYNRRTNDARQPGGGEPGHLFSAKYHSDFGSHLSCQKRKIVFFYFKLFIYAIQLLTKIRCCFLLGFLWFKRLSWVLKTLFAQLQLGTQHHQMGRCCLQIKLVF